jgi:hypothetical protein
MLLISSGILISVGDRLARSHGMIGPDENIVSSTARKSEEVQWVEPPYGNLTCPFEWAKFSCFHQNRLPQGKRGHELALQAWRQHEPQLRTWLAALPAPSVPTELPKLLLVGDSTMRQVFIALGCYFWRRNELRDYSVDWATDWLCQDIPNCVVSGNHSGFNVGHFTVGATTNNNNNNNNNNNTIEQPPKLQVFFLPIAGNALFRQADIVSKWEKELEATHQITFSLQPAARVYQLTKDDTIVYSIGLHVGNRNSIYNTLDKFGRALLSKGPDRPKLVYMNTITQHFPTATGRFAARMIHLPPDQFSCTANVSTNPLLGTELTRIRASVNVDLVFRPTDEEMGLHHVGGNDCTHYCMPGPPDVFALRLIHMLFLAAPPP